MRNLTSCLFVLLFAAIASVAGAQPQPFILVPNSGLPGLANGWVAWGDFDRDGAVDVAICGDSAGSIRTEIYRNNQGFFEKFYSVLPGMNYGNAEWGDYNNDGWLDLLVTGSDSIGESHTMIVAYNGSTFSIAPVSLPACTNGQAHWGDYDNDGRLDILMAGFFMAKILHNDGNDIFSDISAPLPQITDATCNWVDYNNDGQTDVFVSGRTDTEYIGRLFRNNHGTFSEVNTQPQQFRGLCLGSSKWADLDKDGKPDLLITGVDTSEGYILIYKNKGNDEFEEIQNYTFNIFASNLDIADYDNDGYPDFIITGKIHSCGGTALSLLYHNESFMIFNNLLTDIPGMRSGGTSFADYNNDGYTDLLLSGFDSYGPICTRLFRNSLGDTQYYTNNPPDPPGGLVSGANGNYVTLKWNKASDSMTSSEGISYNIFIGTAADTSDIFSPMADLGNGFRKIVCTGNTGQDTCWKVYGLSQGTYYWSVQSIDNGFMSSVFAGIQSFNFIPSDVSSPENVNAGIFPNPCKDKLFISAEKTAGIRYFRIFDSLGKLCLEGTAEGMIDVSILPPGLYLIRLKGDHDLSLRFIKKNP